MESEVRMGSDGEDIRDTFELMDKIRKVNEALASLGLTIDAGGEIRFDHVESYLLPRVWLPVTVGSDYVLKKFRPDSGESPASEGIDG